MAMRLQYWVAFLLVVFVTAAATATLVGGDEVQPTIAEQAEATHESVKNEAIPTISEKIESVKGAAQERTKKGTEQVGESAKSWKDWAYKSAGEWTGKGQKTAGDASESAKDYYTKSASGLHSSSVNAQKSASGKKDHEQKSASGKKDHEQKSASGKKDHEQKLASGKKDHEQKSASGKKDQAQKSASGKKDHAQKSASGKGGHAQKSASGTFNKWSTWAQEKVGRYKPKKNPAAEAVEYINKKRSGSTDEEL